MMELVANCDHLRIKRVGSTDYFLINGTDPVIIIGFISQEGKIVKFTSLDKSIMDKNVSI